MLNAMIVRFVNTYGDAREYFVPLMRCVDSLFQALNKYTHSTNTVKITDLVTYEVLSPVSIDVAKMLQMFGKPPVLRSVISGYHYTTGLDAPASFVTCSKRSKRFNVSADNLYGELAAWLKEFTKAEGIYDLRRYKHLIDNTYLLIPVDYDVERFHTLVTMGNILGIRVITDYDLRMEPVISDSEVELTVQFDNQTFRYKTDVTNIYDSVIDTVLTYSCLKSIGEKVKEISRDSEMHELISFIKDHVTLTINSKYISIDLVENLKDKISEVKVIR